jgi:eukaryotic-like serine/threonine-protein kinase
MRETHVRIGNGAAHILILFVTGTLTAFAQSPAPPHAPAQSAERGSPLPSAALSGATSESIHATPLATTLPHAPEETSPPSSSAPGHDDDGELPMPSATASAKPRPLRVVVQEKEGMLLLPGGEFVMGSSDRKAAEFERPPHKEIVRSFWIDKTEVTVQAYRPCVEKGKCPKPSESSNTCTFTMNDPELPVNCVPFAGANAYCRFVNKRLPREPEWEFAARGTHTIRFPWGPAAFGCGVAATLRAHNSGRSCTPGRPARVGTYPVGASPFGVLDLAGNLEEWVDDVFDGRSRRETPPETTPHARPAAGPNHILRGGSWLLPPSYARTTARNWGSGAEAGPGTGFRCARDPEP